MSVTGALLILGTGFMLRLLTPQNIPEKPSAWHVVEKDVSKDYFVRLRNNYTNEEQLIWQINEAINDPILYIQKYDPDYFYRQIEGIRNRHAKIYDELKNNLQTS